MSNWGGVQRLDVVAVSAKTLDALAEKIQRLAEREDVVSLEFAAVPTLDGAVDRFAGLATLTVEVPVDAPAERRWR
jgi:hypothetical protein